MVTRCGALFAVWLLPALGATIYSNFSAGNTFDTSDGFELGNVGGGNIIVLAQQFTPTGNFTLNQIDVAFFALNPPDNELTLSINADNNGLPGGVLESYDLTHAFGVDQIDTATSTLQPLLVDGSNYWIVAAFTNPASTQDHAVWNLSNNSSATFSPSAFSTDNGTTWAASGQTTQMSVFDVLGTPSGVPEPGPSTQIGAGLLLLAGLGIWRRRTVCKVSGSRAA
jgi:MYXO-CTERM domain-containing protein